MKKSEKYRVAIVAVLDAYRADTCCDEGKVVETLVELCDAYSTALWHEEAHALWHEEAQKEETK